LSILARLAHLTRQNAAHNSQSTGRNPSFLKISDFDACWWLKDAAQHYRFASPLQAKHLKGNIHA